MTTMNPFRARRLRIVEPGWETFSDQFGSIIFDNGVSVEQVSWQEQERLGGLIRIVSAEDEDVEQQVGPAAAMVRSRDPAHGELVDLADRVITLPNGEVRNAGEIRSREELEAVADAKGIAGLRDIAASWGTKGRSINEVINAILAAQDVAVEQGPAAAHTRENSETDSTE